jgi:hypothetical protein
MSSGTVVVPSPIAIASSSQSNAVDNGSGSSGGSSIDGSSGLSSGGSAASSNALAFSMAVQSSPALDAPTVPDGPSLGGVVSNNALVASSSSFFSPSSLSSGGALSASSATSTTIMPHSPTAAVGSAAASGSNISGSGGASTSTSLVVNGNIHNELNPLMQLLNSPTPASHPPTAASVAALLEREELLRKSIKELETKGFGISDALARVNREAKFRVTLDERRKEGELRIAALTGTFLLLLLLFV